jgi:hypothetical protein
MTKIIGGRVNLAIARETTRGVAETPVTGNMYWLPWTATDFDDKAEKYVSREALGNIDDTADQYLTEKWGEGNIEGEIRDKSFGLLLYAALGSWASGANGAAFNHTFTVAQTNQHTSLSIWVDDPNSDYLFELAMMENLDITIETGKLATFTAGFVSMPSQSTSMVAGINSVPAKSALAAENKFIATNASIRIATDRNNFGPAPEVYVQNLKVTISKNLKRKHTLGSMSPNDIINQTMAVEGSFTLPYDSKTYKDYMLQDVYKALEIKLENRAVDLGGGVNPTIRIQLPRVGFHNWTPARPKGELYEQTINFRAFRDVTNNENMIYNIVLTNAVGLTGY